MRILHYNVFKNVPIGVRNQLLDEAKAVAKIGDQLEWDIAVTCMCDWAVPFRTSVRSGKKPGLLTDILFYRDAYAWLKRVAARYDKVLVRYRTANPWQAMAIRDLDNIYTVHHAIEEMERGAGRGIKSILERWIELIAGPYSLASVKGIIALTPEILSYETGRASSKLSGWVYPNGICLRDINVVPDRREGNLKFLFLGSLDAPWHGLDIAIEGLLSVEPDVEIHVIGPRTGVSSICSGKIIFHGELTRGGLGEVAEICDAGLGTFALEKKGMRQACTLKVREYLSIGLPVVSGAMDSGFPCDFHYYFTKTDSIGWNLVIDKVRQWRKITRDQVRDASTSHIDKQLIMMRLLEQL